MQLLDWQTKSALASMWNALKRDQFSSVYVRGARMCCFIGMIIIVIIIIIIAMKPNMLIDWVKLC